jgi:hypothetical protein
LAHRFDQIGIAARQLALDPIGRGRITRQHNHWRLVVFRMPLNGPADRITVDARQDHIQEDNVVALAIDEFQGIFARLGKIHMLSQFLQGCFQLDPDRQAVVHDQRCHALPDSCR